MILSVKCNHCGHWQHFMTSDFPTAKFKCNGCGKVNACYGKDGTRIDCKEFQTGQQAVCYSMTRNNEGQEFKEDFVEANEVKRKFQSFKVLKS